MEKIVAIEEGTIGDLDGYVITTTDRVIKLQINNEQDCCEQFGYFSSEENPQTFVGATLLGVGSTDKALKTELLSKGGYDEEECIFITLITDRGDLQFAVYNSHNGYYGHSVRIVIGDHEENDIL